MPRIENNQHDASSSRSHLGNEGDVAREPSPRASVLEDVHGVEYSSLVDNWRNAAHRDRVENWRAEGRARRASFAQSDSQASTLAPTPQRRPSGESQRELRTLTLPSRQTVGTSSRRSSSSSRFPVKAGTPSEPKVAAPIAAPQPVHHDVSQRGRIMDRGRPGRQRASSAVASSSRTTRNYYATTHRLGRLSTLSEVSLSDVESVVGVVNTGAEPSRPASVRFNERQPGLLDIDLVPMTAANLNFSDLELFTHFHVENVIEDRNILNLWRGRDGGTGLVYRPPQEDNPSRWWHLDIDWRSAYRDNKTFKVLSAIPLSGGATWFGVAIARSEGHLQLSRRFWSWLSESEQWA